AVAIARDEVPLDGHQHMPQVLRVWPVGGFGEAEAERLARLLREVHQLVDLQQGDEGVGHRGEVGVHQAQEHRASGGHGGRVPGDRQPRRGGVRVGLVDDRPHIGERGERLLDQRQDLGPA
ncbi:MAG: hypothetical protein ACK559_38520, partial [bacterium]